MITLVKRKNNPPMRASAGRKTVKVFVSGYIITHLSVVCNESDTSMLEEMQQKLISIAEDFDKWLEEMAKKYNMPKDEIQALIKQFLIGL